MQEARVRDYAIVSGLKKDLQKNRANEMDVPPPPNLNNIFMALFLAAFAVYVASWRLLFSGMGENDNLGMPYDSDQMLTEVLWFKQKLDHFDPTNTESWQQRYFLNSSFFDVVNGPVFLMIGGESRANPSWLINGTWLRYAEKNKALCILLEHRYYGKSRPVRDLSVENLAYLSSQQALADIASFIVHMNSELGRNAKWIVFGGSYAGSLAAWVRLKYPHLVLGAVSSSGPLLAVADFKDYYYVVEEILSAYDKKCVDAIKEGTRQFSKLMKRKSGRLSVYKLFELCRRIDPGNKNEISDLYESLASNFAAVVQYNNDNRHERGPKMNVNSVCGIMTNQSVEDEVDRLAVVNSMLLREKNESCLDFNYNSMIKKLSSIDWTSKAAEGMRQWTYQTCTEFGFFQTSSLNSTKELFGSQFPVEYFEMQCKDIFGPKFDKNLLEEGIKRTNMIYGGLNIQVDNVVFVQGSVDPWHRLGITKTLRKTAPAIYIEGTAHCANMYPSTPNDLPQLVSARNKIEELIGIWLNGTDK